MNQGFAREWSGESASTAARLPEAATSVAFPPIDAADSQAPSTYALAFTQELLDVDFAASTRKELLAWASYNNAPNSLVTMPAAINLKLLPASLTMNPTPSTDINAVEKIGGVANELARQRTRHVGESHLDAVTRDGLAAGRSAHGDVRRFGNAHGHDTGSRSGRRVDLLRAHARRRVVARRIWRYGPERLDRELSVHQDQPRLRRR